MTEAPHPPELTCQRGRFSLPAGLHYLNCAYMSPLPIAVEDAVVAGLRRKRDPSEIEPRHFFEDAEEVRRLFGALVNADPERVAILPSVSYGISLCARNLGVARGQTVVLTGEQFPGNVYAWRRVAGEVGAEVVTVEAPAGPSASGGSRGEAWNERLLEAIDRRTAVVTLPQVHWTDGTRFDLAAIGARARSVGAAVIVDGTQSVGALPFDVGELQPDAVVSSTYKWLLGPYASALAYLGPRFQDGVPLEETWMGREGSEDFQHLVDYRDGYRPGSRRYDVGEVANFALLPGVLSGLEMVTEWGPSRVQAYCRALTGDLVREVQTLGFSIETIPWRAEHLFGIRMRADIELTELAQRLKSSRVVASLRGSALRVSPNTYNAPEDVAALLEVLSAV